METYYEQDGIRLYHGDAADVLPTLEAESISAVVSDPPAGIAFMSKSWDRDKGGRDQWVAWLASILSECNRTMKPGAHAVIWALPRTSGWTHRAIEDAGLDVRDCVTHLFGSGFPKSHNLPGGLGTALKPAAEFWYLARKPLSGTVAATVLAHGTGALNIDASRIGTEERETWGSGSENYKVSKPKPWRETKHMVTGRWPANVILDEDAAAALDQMSGERKSGGGLIRKAGNHASPGGWNDVNRSECRWEASTGGASRYFPVLPIDDPDTLRFRYEAKAPAKERWGILTCNCETVKLEAWESAGQSPNDQTDTTSRQPDTSEVTSTDGSDLHIPSSGSNTTAPSLTATSSTTSTATSRTTESRTCNSSTPSRTSGCTPAANSEMVSGGSRVDSAASSSPSTPSTGTSAPKAGRSTASAAPVTSLKSLSQSVCENCGAPRKLSSHPTQKPLALMRWLLTLVTPNGGTVLDPFAGSGTTGVAAAHLGIPCVLIEQEAEYLPIIAGRIDHALNERAGAELPLFAGLEAQS